MKRRDQKARRRRKLSYQMLESRRLLAAQPVISEFMANNVTSIEDGYGASPDWIELYNAGDAAVDLEGYHLTDDASDLNRWTFPSSTVLAPGEFRVVFASGLGVADPQGNHHTSFQLGLDGDYLALTAPDQTVLSEYSVGGADYPPQVTDISYGIGGAVLIDAAAASEILVPADGSLAENWTANGFDGLTSGFSLGRAAIGYENNPGTGSSFEASIETIIDPGTTNVYVRTEFEIENASTTLDLQLQLKYDDGAVVYLNGTRVIELNAPDPLDYNTPATATHSDALALQGVTFDLSAHVGLVVDGTNTLAIHALNAPDSSDFLMSPRLSSQSISGGEGYLLGATPGGPNTLTRELGPSISNVAASVPIAVAGQALTVTASISDFAAPLATSTPTLHYRVMHGAENPLAMVDDGTSGDAVAADGVYTAQIPGADLVAGEMIRWYVTASDATGIESRAPTFLSPLDSAEYFGTIVGDAAVTTDLPVFYWYLENESAASTSLGTRASLFVDGEFYDNIEVNNHGQSTRGSAFPKKSFDFDANSANKFQIWDGEDRVSDFNLLTNYADQTKLRNTLTYDLFAQAGFAHHLAMSVMVYRNGDFYGLYDVVEEGDTEYLDRLGRGETNALYKVNNRINSSTNRVEKKSREWEDHSDFQEVIDAAQTLEGAIAKTWDHDNLDVADFINYLAIQNVTQSHDFGHKNFYWFRDSEATRLWSVFPWDQDLSLGHIWDGSVSPSYFKDELITNLNIYLGNNPIFQRLYGDPTFKQMYTRRVRSLTDQFYGLEGTASVDSYLGQHIVSLESKVAEEAVLDSDKWGIHPNFTRTPAEAAQQLLDEFIPLRRSFLNNHPDVPASQPASPTILFDQADYDADPISGVQFEEYVRLNNPNSYAVDISDWELAGGISHRFKGGTVIPAGGMLYVVKDVQSFLQRATGPSGGQQLLIQGNYDGQLTFSGEDVSLIDATGAQVDSLTTPASAPTPLQQFLRVTELHYNPQADDTEFIELTNVSSGAFAMQLDLGGVSISDGPSSPFVFPAGTMLAAGERILVVQDSVAMLAAYPTLSASLIAGQYLGKLSNNGERIKVVGPGGETLFDVTYSDGDPWPIAADGNGSSLELIDPKNTSIQRLDKPYSWAASSDVGGTPGADRSAAFPIRINEVLSHTDAPEVDAIELYNVSSDAVDIGGWFLSDSGQNPLKFQIPAGTILPAGGFLVFDEHDFNPTPLTPGTNDFALSGSHGDAVWLSIANQDGTLLETLVDQVEFGATFNGVSLGRPEDGNGRLVPMAQSTLGESNASHRTASLVITELNYHPTEPSATATATDPSIDQNDLEFVEVFNHSDVDVDLTNWRLRGTSDFDFLPGTLAAGELLVIVQFDPQDAAKADRLAAFRAHYGIDESVRLVGPMSPSLSNSYGIAKLQQPDEAPVDEPTVTPRVLVDEVFYDDLLAWPEQADGSGSSLQRSGVDQNGNDPSSWRAATPTPGITRLVPSIESVVVNGGGPTRSEITSIDVTFDAVIDLSNAAIGLTNLSTSTAVTGIQVAGSDDGDQSTIRITFDGGPSVAARAAMGDTLANGDYVLRISGTEVTASIGGATMDGDVTFGSNPIDRFFRKYGDHDGDGSVGLLDFAAFRSTFGLASGDSNFRGDLDQDGDGAISLLDFAEFRRGFGS